jgi:hypothetical protein
VKIVFAALGLATLTASLGVADDRLNAAIGPPKVALYRSIRDARDWRNPILTVQDDGVVITANRATDPAHVRIEDVKEFLIKLPVGAWPYGRVVAQSDQSLLPVPFDDYIRKMSKIRQQLAVVLRDLGVHVEFWPSA